MPLQISISNAIGSRGVTAAGGYDPDAQAFITAASITDPTQQSAINQLVLDLKGYSIWTKFSALYPMVGGTNSKHSWNLKNTSQFQISWIGGVTSSANGIQFNGTNSYGITGYNPSTNGTLNSHHFSFYSRTNSNGTEIEAGLIDANGRTNLLEIRTSGTTYVAVNSSSIYTTFADTDSRAFYLANRTASNVVNAWRNSTKKATGTTASTALPNGNHWLGAWNNIANPALLYYSTKQCAFASIGDGLTDTEAANFYTAVQAYQTTLGRSIGTQTVSDADAQAFVTAANITDQVQANAINNLVIGMKADGLWTKMKAIYPIVGGSASSHAVNLKTPGTYNLTFSTGWTHSSTGMTPNGTSAYANTSLVPSSVLSLNSTHISGYIRTNLVSHAPMLSSENAGSYDNGLYIWPLQNQGYYSVRINDNTSTFSTVTYDIRGFHVATRTASNVKKYRVNTTEIFNSGVSSTALNTSSIYIGASRNNANYFSNQIAFNSIGDGLTDTEAVNFRTAVQAFQTTLGRQV